MRIILILNITASLFLPTNISADNKGEYNGKGWQLPIPISDKTCELRTLINGKAHTIWSFNAVTKVNGRLSVDTLYCEEYIIAGHIFMYSVDFDTEFPPNYFLIDRNGDGVFRWKVQYRHLKYLPIDPPKWVFTNINI